MQIVHKSVHIKKVLLYGIYGHGNSAPIRRISILGKRPQIELSPYFDSDSTDVSIPVIAISTRNK